MKQLAGTVARTLIFLGALAVATDVRGDGVADLRIAPTSTTTISTTGSYRLVGSVTMTANVPAINITAPNVTLDLNGHTITGAGASTTDGITSGQDGIVLSNGKITGFGKCGVKLTGARARAIGLQVVNCNRNGGNAVLLVGRSAIVENCQILNNSPATGTCTGISTNIRSRVKGNIVQANSSLDESVIGIYAEGGSEIEDNIVSDNFTNGASVVVYGIQTGVSDPALSSVVRNNTVVNNAVTGSSSSAYGIIAYNAVIESNNASEQSKAGAYGQSVGILAITSHVIGNQCNNNSVASGSNGSAYGIFVGSGNLVRGNTCSFNQGDGTGESVGIVCQGRNRIENNHCVSNTGGNLSVGIFQNSPNSPIFAEGNLIIGNHTSHHTEAGIMFRASIGQRCQQNYCHETEVIESNLTGAVMPDSLPTPGSDIDNVLY